MGFGKAFDVNRVTNLETRANADEAAMLTNNNLNTQNVHLLNVIGANNAFNLVSANTQTQWLGIMNDTSTYAYAMGKFATGQNVVELRAYLDHMTIRTGRSAAATNADFYIITNDAGVGAISANINLQPGLGGVVNITPHGAPSTLYFDAVTNAGINYGQSKLKLMNDGSNIAARNVGDTAYIPLLASAFTVNSEMAAKENINEYTDPVLPKVNETKVHSFQMKDQPKPRTDYGLLKEYAPEELHHEDGINLYSMVSMLWKAVQELSAKVEELSR